MKKFLGALFAFWMGIFPGVSKAATQCTYNGKEIPCEDMPGWILWFILGIFVLLIAGVVFWIMMLVDAAKHKSESQVVWILVICLTGIIGALIYYFVVKRERDDQSMNNVKMPPAAPKF